MSLVVPQAAELQWVSDEISLGPLVNLYCRLFATNVTINSSTTLASLLAAEASFAGYAKVALTTWSTPSIDGSGAAATTCTQAQFIPTGSAGSGSIYGYFLTDSAGSKFYGAEALAGAPITVPQSATYEIDITWTGLSRY